MLVVVTWARSGVVLWCLSVSELNCQLGKNLGRTGGVCQEGMPAAAVGEKW